MGITWESICQDWELVRILLQEKVQIPKIGNNKDTPNVKTQYWLLHEKQCTNLGNLVGLLRLFPKLKPQSWVLHKNFNKFPIFKTQH